MDLYYLIVVRAAKYDLRKDDGRFGPYKQGMS